MTVASNTPITIMEEKISLAEGISTRVMIRVSKKQILQMKATLEKNLSVSMLVQDSNGRWYFVKNQPF
jgi:hypothetical protein